MMWCTDMFPYFFATLYRSFQLHPYVKSPDTILYGNVTKRQYVQLGELRKSEYFAVVPAGGANATKPILYPTADIIIKHYVYQSWEEYKSQRGSK